MPVSPPDNVQNTEVTKTSLSFAWGDVPCGSRAGMIAGFDYNLTNLNTRQMQKGSTGPNAKQVTISGLDSCTMYNFSVAAKTSEGTGPYSAPVQVSTQVEGKNSHV